MKAQATITDTIGILSVILITVVAVTQMLPRILSVLIETFSRTSAENVARQLASLITISGASTYKIQIEYTPTKEVLYEVSSGTRTIKVVPKVVPKYEVSYAEESSSTQPYAVDLSFNPFRDVNTFSIKKEVIDDNSRYSFGARKTE